MSDDDTSIDARLIKAISHPLRHRILQKLNEYESSPSDLARELGEPLGNVSYHVQILLKNDAIELVDTRPARGALEHIYRATARPFFEDEDWAKLPVSLRRKIFDVNLQQLWEHVVEAARSEGLDHPLTHISWVALDLDEQGLQEMADLTLETLNRAMEIQAEALSRLSTLAADDRETQRTELAIMHYHRPRKADVHRSARATSDESV